MTEPRAAPLVQRPFSSREGWRATWQYWVRDPAVGLLHTIVYRTLRVLPLDAAWAIGRPLGYLQRRWLAPNFARRVASNWKWLRPGDRDPDVVEAAVKMTFRNTASSFLEYGILHRVWRAGRIAVVGAEHIAAAQATGRPVLIASLHLGNWEMITPTLVGLGYPMAAIYHPPPNRFSRRIVIRAREQLGIKLVRPSFAGTREALRVLTERSHVMVIFIDEYKDGGVPAPAFGRPHKTNVNIAYVARLATTTDAVVIPSYAERLDGARFRMTFLPPVELARNADTDAGLLADIERIDAVIDPIVRAHLDQWLPTFALRRKARLPQA